MPEDVEYRCFIGNLSWTTSDRGLKDAFEKFGNILEAKVALDKFSGRSRGFGFVTFDDKAAMEEAIEAMNGMDLDGRNITVDRAKPQQGSGRDYDGDRNRDRGRDSDRDRNRGYDSGRGSNGVVVMALIGMEIDLVGAAGMQVVVGALEVIDTVVIVLDRTNVVEQEVLVLDKMTFVLMTRDAEFMLCEASSFFFAGCALFIVVWVEQYKFSPFEQLPLLLSDFSLTFLNAQLWKMVRSLHGINTVDLLAGCLAVSGLYGYLIGYLLLLIGHGFINFKIASFFWAQHGICMLTDYKHTPCSSWHTDGRVTFPLNTWQVVWKLFDEFSNLCYYVPMGIPCSVWVQIAILALFLYQDLVS
ncbi:hypothetical protein DITRI_Ditri03aG0110200 [Diplodiscus trichospermus]